MRLGLGYVKGVVADEVRELVPSANAAAGFATWASSPRERRRVAAHSSNWPGPAPATALRMWARQDHREAARREMWMRIG